MRMWKAGILLAALFWVATAGTAAAPEAPITNGASVADAAMGGDVVTLRALLEQGSDVNARFGDGMTGLHWAARKGDAAIAEVLIGADLEATTRIGAHTPLHVASAAGRASVVQELLLAGANPNAMTTTGATPLHFAAASGNALAVAALVEHGANVNAAEPQWGQTALMFAAAAGRTEVVEVLLEGEADPSIAAKVVDLVERNEYDQSERRERNKHIAKLRAAAKKDAPIESNAPRETETEPEDRDEALRRGGEPVPLDYAALVASHGGLTPLLLAAREGHVGTALALIQSTADINQVSAADNTSPMLIAMFNGHFDLAMQLYELGADPSVASDAGATPLYAALNLHWAPKARHPQPVADMQQELTYIEVMETLLKAGVDPNVRLNKTLWYTTYNRDLLGVNRAGATPFWRAAHALDIEAMRLLLAHGADPNMPTLKNSRTKAPRRRRGQHRPLGLAARSARRPRGLPSPCRFGRWPRSRLRRQFPSPRARWMAPRREVSRGRARRRRERKRLQGLQYRTPCSRSWRQRAHPLSGVERRRSDLRQPQRSDDGRHGEWPRAARPALSGDRCAAR